MLDAARQNNVKRFIFASSNAPVGGCEPPVHEELAPQPVSPYGASKLAGEAYCYSFFRTFGMATVSLRFGNVYGPGSKHKNSVIAKFIKQALAGEVLEIYGDVTQTRDFIYIDDLINAIRKAVALQPPTKARLPRPPRRSGRSYWGRSGRSYRGAIYDNEEQNEFHRKLSSSLLTPNSLLESPWGQVFQIATARETTVEEMVDELLPILAKYGVTDVQTVHGEKRKGDVLRNYSDTTKAYEVLGWECTYLLVDGLEKTVEWFVKRN